MLPESLHCEFIHTDIRSAKDGKVDCLIVTVSTKITISLPASEKKQMFYVGPIIRALKKLHTGCLAGKDAPQQENFQSDEGL